MVFETFGRSWEITKISLSILNKDKELLLYPILTLIFSTIIAIILAIPLLIGKFLGAPFYILMLLVFYFAFNFVYTFFYVCATYTAKTRFEGGNATVGSSIAFALSIVHLIVYWSILAATIGVVLKLLQNFANNQKNGIIKMILNIVVKALGLAWNIITIFVVPAMVFKKLGPFDSIKESISALKKTWGEKLILFAGVFALEGMLSTIGFIGLIIGIILSFLAGSWVLLIFVVVIFVVYMILLKTFFSVLNSIFNTALYIYATTGKIPTGFTKEQMQGAIKSESQ